jgi:hypothetical protein
MGTNGYKKSICRAHTPQVVAISLAVVVDVTVVEVDVPRVGRIVGSSRGGPVVAIDAKIMLCRL